MRRHAVALALAATLAVGETALAQSAPADGAESAVQARQGLDATARRGVVEAAVRLLTEAYVYPDAGRQAATVISRNLAAGEYDAITEPGAFARRLSEDLNDVAHDKHLRVFAEGQGPERDGDNGPPPRSELGFARVDVLDGNVGYVELTGFVPAGLFRPAADKAMRLLAGTDALVIDLRGNRGGDPAAVAYLASFFFDAKEPVHLNDLLWREAGTAEYRREVFRTEATPLSYLDKPVVLLTGPRTFSGGEEFAYDMQALKRATLVGESTGGGANPGDMQPLQAGLAIFLPTGRAENPVTRTSWEGAGVQPDLPSPPAEAFASAYRTAQRAAGKTSLADTPLSGPDDVLSERLLMLRTTAQPGSEAAIRRSIAEFQAGTPRYDLLSPFLAERTRADLPYIHADIVQFGAVESVDFIEVGPMGDDVYEVKFARGVWLWSILLDEDGTIVMAGFRPKGPASGA